jgi:predicted LPLAT superfamily acyltransferase
MPQGLQSSRVSHQSWSEPNVGPKWHLRLFAWLLRWGGMTRAYHISYFATLWYVLFYPSIRERSRFYLDRRFPERRGRLRRFLDSYRLVRTFGETLVDMAALGVLGNSALSSLSPDRERLYAMVEEDKGLIMLLAHVGCWQVGMSATGDFPRRIWHVLIPEPRTLAMLDESKVGFIDPRSGLEGVMRMTEALLRGEIVAMMGDRTFGGERNRVDARFLGGTIKLPITPYRLASASGSPVVVMLAAKIAKRGYKMRLAKVIEVPPGIGRNPGDYAPYAQQFADCLEEFVAEYPWQFFDFFDLWKNE